MSTGPPLVVSHDRPLLDILGIFPDPFSSSYLSHGRLRNKHALRICKTARFHPFTLWGKYELGR